MPSLFIVLEKELSNFDSFVNGHALFEAVRDLDPLADQLGIKSLMSFFGQVPKVQVPADDSETEDETPEDPDAPDPDDQTCSDNNPDSPDEVSEEDLVEAPKAPVEKWFLISDGLRTVETYLHYLGKSAYAIPNASLIKKELLEWKRVLYLASQELRLWHLGIEK